MTARVGGLRGGERAMDDRFADQSKPWRVNSRGDKKPLKGFELRKER